MNHLCVIILMTSCLYMSSCQSDNISSDYSFLEESQDDKVPETLLFSNNTDIQEEHNYYDALRTVQKKYPDRLNSTHIVSESDHSLVNYYGIDTFPTLLLVEDLEVKLRIEGANEFSSILNELKYTLLDD
ncbi:hypothetical protein [Salipaludibacillus aurantiacus]|uniref:Thioredoxin n=1 Tax=Salipaludibacillus aurantiacus TaxID=1601833 RepID=A0A1H9WZW5_9BACI|nr:hypothetical protein [Salipaludibacillus aurantiacus]SES39450.1 hypothetical protein SAMN05518684_12232 [Salipaludibacillus aurantiacus]